MPSQQRTTSSSFLRTSSPFVWKRGSTCFFSFRSRYRGTTRWLRLFYSMVIVIAARGKERERRLSRFFQRRLSPAILSDFHDTDRRIVGVPTAGALHSGMCVLIVYHDTRNNTPCPLSSHTSPLLPFLRVHPPPPLPLPRPPTRSICSADIHAFW